MIEPLESRIAPALTVFSVHGTLFVSGDPHDNVTINELADHKIQVKDGAGTFDELGGIHSIKIDLKGDDNQLSLNFAFGYAGSTSVTLAGGNNSVTFIAGPAGKASISGGVGNDTVLVPLGVVIGGGLKVKGGSGANLLDLRGHVGGNVSFDSGLDSDTVLVTAGAQVDGSFTVKASGGSNATTLGGTIDGNVKVSGGSGEDTVTISEGIAIGGNATFLLGSGDNVFSGTAATGASLGQIDGNLTILTGSGDDNVQLNGFAVTGNVVVHLGGGANSFTIPLRSLAGSEIAAFTAPRLNYVGGSGVDTILIASSLSTVGTGFFAFGPGDDLMTYSGGLPVFTWLTVNGGSGKNDTFSPQSVVGGIDPKFVGLEHVIP
jgi:hypothetical protein